MSQSQIIYPVLYAPQTDAPILAGDSIIVAGKRMSAASALSRYTPAEITAAGYRFPTGADAAAVAAAGLRAEAERLLVAAAGGYGWPEAAEWQQLEADARAYLSDPNAGPGLALAADCEHPADAAALAARAGKIVELADLFRPKRGAIVQWRRAALAAVEQALAAGADSAAIQALAAAQVLAAPAT